MHDSTALISSPASSPDAMGLFIGRICAGLQSEHSRRAYERGMREFAAFMSEKREAPSKGLLNEFKLKLRTDGRGDAAINSILVATRRFLKEAADAGMLDPVEVERAVKVEGITRRGQRAGNWLTSEQCERMLQLPDVTTAMGLRDRAILALFLGAGIRRGEAVNLTVEHFQMREGRWCIVDILGKRNKLRTIPIPAWTKAIVDLWLSAAGITGGLVCRVATRAKDSARNKFKVDDVPLSAQAIFRVVVRYAGKVGVPSLRPHDLRRTFAQLSRKGGAALEQIQLTLGHESIATTERYLGSRLDYQNSAADHLGLNVRVSESV